MTESLSLNMEPIRDFTERLDTQHSKKFNYLGYFREMGMIEPVAHRVKDLNKEMLEKYLRLLEEHK